MKSPVNFDQSQKLEPAVQDMNHLRKLFIGGLSPATNEDSLRAFYSKWGEVLDAVVMRDSLTKRSRGFGFVTFADSTMVDKAQAARPHVIDDKNVDSKRALPRPELGKSDSNMSVKKIFVGGLKDSHDEQTLSEHFSQFGNVVSVKILTDKATGRKRGFAFVEFDDYDSVDKAVLHKNHTIKYVLVDVKKSVYKQEMAKKFGNQPPGSMGQQNGAMATGNAPGGYQQTAATPYNTQTAYAYQPQGHPQAYNGWGAYGPPAYQQPPPAVPAASYGAYGAAPQNGTWNASAYPAPAGSWGQAGYATPTAQAAPVAGAPVANGWNTASTHQSFGDYQQSYNGGPQKAGNLQGNRMNPYSVSSNSNYDSFPSKKPSNKQIPMGKFY